MFGKKKDKKKKDSWWLKKTGRVKDEGVKKGKKSLAEIIGMKKSKYDKRK